MKVYRKNDETFYHMFGKTYIQITLQPIFPTLISEFYVQETPKTLLHAMQ